MSPSPPLPSTPHPIPAGVGVFSMHPGWADTEGVRTSIPGFHSAFQAKLRDTAQGADTIVWLGLADSTALQPGAFYLDRQPQAKHLTLGGTGYSSGEAAELYSKVLQMAGLKEEGAAGAAAAVEGGGGATSSVVETAAATGAADGGDVQQASSGAAAVPLAEQGGKQ